MRFESTMKLESIKHGNTMKSPNETWISPKNSEWIVAHQLIINRFTIPMKDCGNRKNCVGSMCGYCVHGKTIFLLNVSMKLKLLLK